MVLLDLQKAIDTVDHSVLLAKLESVGLDWNSDNVMWFKSYLSDRMPGWCWGVLSKIASVDSGVPQGSILGPMLFLVYVNDLPAAMACDYPLYADDTVLLSPGKSVTDVEQNLNSQLEYVNKWLIQNKLSLHVGKTESILFATKKKLLKQSSL